MTIHLATNNHHKLKEFRAALPQLDIRIPADLGIAFDFPENGSTFLENSSEKALALWRMIQAPVLADDSGLCVDALDGRPGVLSARYGSSQSGRLLESAERNALLLAEMAGFADRTCRFVCCLSLVLGPARLYVIQETCEGELLLEARGHGGFGYDPVVFLPALGKSVAELGMDEKNQVSHRGRAIQRMAVLLADPGMVG